MKQCIKCGLTKELSCFYTRSNGSLRNDCKACKNKSNRDNYYADPNKRLSKIKEWRESNKDLVREYDKKLQHKRRVPTTLSEFDSFVWQEAHRLSTLRSSLLGGEWHIDHIVPVNHKQACGLNNGYNLQVVPAKWNMKKGNRNMNKWMDINNAY